MSFHNANGESQKGVNFVVSVQVGFCFVVLCVRANNYVPRGRFLFCIIVRQTAQCFNRYFVRLDGVMPPQLAKLNK
jgi:hypothetical protein